MTEVIPGPPGIPLLGNALDIDGSAVVTSFSSLSKQYGPIYKLRMPNAEVIVVSSQELYDELCDERRFTKRIGPALNEVRAGAGAGLFTAHYGEHDWDIAHRVLTPAFGPIAISGMFNQMYDIAKQLALKWARFGPESDIQPTEDFTRLTLDTIALCSMDTRFNSFYSKEQHPFVTAMGYFLKESGQRSNRPHVINSLMRSTEREFFESVAVLQNTAQEIVQDKRRHPTGKKDLITAMLDGKDPKTGEKMSDQNIANNMITFLIAGHETTSGTLSFLLYRWLFNPSTLEKAREEVDRVIGQDAITAEHMSKLPYLTACLRETLRLNPPAPIHVLGVHPNSSETPVIIGKGRYQLERHQSIAALSYMIHRDPKIWGDDVEDFRPERMLDENFNKLPKNSWKPFGNASRACIGRDFAWQEMMLCMAMLLQNFDFEKADPDYILKVSQTLTMKPSGFEVRARLRHGLDAISLERSLTQGRLVSHHDSNAPVNGVSSGDGKPLAVFFGGNMGTCESLASKIAGSAPAHGYTAEVKPLDEAAEDFPTDRPVLIISASYEGAPPDNAVQFVKWLENAEENTLTGAKYAVFGCGNRDWKLTFQRIPTLIDSTLQLRGATRLTERGVADAADNNVFNDFEKWEDSNFWAAIEETFGVSQTSITSKVELEIETAVRASHLKIDMKLATVTENRQLTFGNSAVKKFMNLDLPFGMTYRAGDYLALLPLNPESMIARVCRQFSIPLDTRITVKKGSGHLPVGVSLSLREILDGYVELNQPATIRNINTIRCSIPEESLRKELEDSSEDFQKQITQKRISVLDLLEQYPTAKISFGEFLAMLPPLRPRQYSISSSPLADKSKVGITFAVLDEDAFQGNGKRYQGVASNYLSALSPGDQVLVNVKESHASFHLPQEADSTPIIMIAAGAGLAPFRGFIEERAEQIKAGAKPAPATLFFGCRHPEQDYLFKEELAAWQKLGAVDVRCAFSRKPASSGGAKYVQDRMWLDRADVLSVLDRRGHIYVCGKSVIADATQQILKKIHVTRHAERNVDISEAEAERWFVAMRNEQYMADVFD